MGAHPEGLETVTTLDALAGRVAQGEPLALEDAPLLLGTHDLIALGSLADAVRRQLHGARATFGRVLEVHVDAVPATLPAGASAGEIRLVGRPASLAAACTAVSAARALAGEGPLTGFSLMDVSDLPGGDEVFRRLAASGLDALAEVRVDAPGVPDEAIERARAAGLRVERLTVGAAPADPIALLASVLELQRRVGGLRAFAPLPRVSDPAAPSTGYDDVRLIALSRLLLREIPTVQVDWPLYGPKLAQVALVVGADDVDGVAAVESVGVGLRRSALEEILRNIRAAGLEPVERDGAFAVRRVGPAPVGQA